MARSNWIGGSLLVLALTTAGWGQTPSSPYSPTGKSGERIITLQELNLPPQKCRVVKSWKTPEGAQAYQVQSLETNEMLTVLESGEMTPAGSGKGPKVKAVATRIFHWGQANKPPVGCPAAPDVEVATTVTPAVEKTTKPASQPIQKVSDTKVSDTGMALPAPSSMTPSLLSPPAALPPVASKPVAQTTLPQMTKPAAPAPLPPMASKPVAQTTTPQVTTKPMAQMPKAETQPFPSPQGTEKVGTSVPSSTPRPLAAPTQVYPPKKEAGVPGNMWPAAFADQAPHEVVDPVVANQQKPKEQTKPSVVPSAQPISVYPPTSSTPVKVETKKTTPSVKTETVQSGVRTDSAKPNVKVEPAQPTDYRQSWGKVESKPVEPVDAHQRIFSKTTPTSPPQSKHVTNDPLSTPDVYSKKIPGVSPTPSAPVPVVAEPMKTPTLPTPKPTTMTVPSAPPAPPLPTALPPKTDALKTPVMTPPAPPAPTPLSHNKPVVPPVTQTAGVGTTTPAVTPAVVSPTTLPPVVTPAVEVVPTPVQPAPGFSLGSGSVMAAGDPQYIPVPVVTVPDFRRPPQVPTSRPPQAPQPNRSMVQASQGAGGNVDQVANAFTNPGPARPLPTDMGKMGPMNNAFVGSDTGVVAPPQGMPPGMPQGMPTAMMQRPPMMGQPQIVPGGAVLMPQTIPGMAQGPHQAPGTPQMAMGQQYPPSTYPAPGMGQPVMPAQYRQTQAVQPSGAPSLPQTIAMLTQSDYPSQREWAADQLSELNGRQHPQAVDALASTARHDPAPLVRCACLRALARMGAATVPVLATVEAMKNDPDPRVRDAAGEALTGLTSGVQQAGRVQ